MPVKISVGDKSLLFGIVLCRSMACFIAKGHRLVDTWVDQDIIA